MPFGQHTDLSPGTAGALFSTLADLTQRISVQVNDGRVGDLQLVSPDNLKQLHLPQTIIPGGGINEALMGNPLFTYSMGWFIEPYRGLTLVHHGGNVEGHSLIIGFVPQESIGVVALTNIAMLPLRDVLLYESIDRALNLPGRDWNQRFHAMFDPLVAGMAKAKQTTQTEKVADAPPTHPLDTYSGIYAADGYPDFEVRQTEDGLQARLVGSLDWSGFRHHHYNLFEWHLEDFDEWYKVRFLVNDNGEIDAVSIPIEPAVDNVNFARKLPDLSEDLISALTGTYQFPIEGMAVTITTHEEKVYAAQTGSPPQEIKLYKLNQDVVGFKQERARFDFMRQNESISGLVLKTPGMTLEATKVSDKSSS